MQQYLLKRGPLSHNGSTYTENDSIALTADEAAPLLRLGIIEPDAAADAKAAEEAAKAEAEAKAAADAKATETNKAPTAKAKK